MPQRRKLPPIHPGALLRDELREIGVSFNELARALPVPMNRISAIVNGNRAITVDTAMRLARYFGTSPQYWINLQSAYDLEVAEREIRPQIEREVLPRTAARSDQLAFRRTSSTASGCFAITASSTRVGASGYDRPCSQFLRVAGGNPNLVAN